MRVSPSGKAMASQAIIRGFESRHPLHVKRSGLRVRGPLFCCLCLRTVPRMNSPVIKRLGEILASRPLPRVRASRVLRLMDEAFGPDMRRFADGRMLIWEIARHDGYNIPPYPMAGCGDVKEFLEDEGVRNVPDWYREKLGMTRDEYDSIYSQELVMVRNRALWRKVWQVPTQTMRADTELGEALARSICAWCDFALGCQDDRDDPKLFRR